MNTQPHNPQENIELRLRTLQTLWIGLMLSIVAYFGLTLFVGRPEGLEPNSTLSIVLLAIAALTTLLSFPIKSKLFNQAIDQQQVQMVQQAYIVAGAMCEVGALLGVLDFFLTSNRFYYVLFIIGVLGQLLNFPRREHVLNAWGTKPLQ